MRTAPMGPSKGMPESIRAAEAPLMARTSWGFSWSAPRMVATMWTSLRKPSGNDGRRGRSIRRQVRMAWSVARPSRRKNEPGILPAAYIRSSTSTVRGKKSTPSRTPLEAQAVDRTTVSPMRATTAPLASWASLPASNERVLPVSAMGPDTDTGSVICVLLCLSDRSSDGQFPVVSHPDTHAPGSWRLAADSCATLPGGMERAARRPLGETLLPAQAEAGDKRPVALDVVLAHVVEQAPPATDEHEQAPPAVVVLLVHLEMLGEVVDALREDC